MQERITRLTKAGILGLIVISFIVLVFPSIYIGELFSHFTFQYVCLGLLLGASSIYIRKINWLIVCLGIAAVHTLQFISLYYPQDIKRDGSDLKTLSVLSINVLRANDEYDKVLEQIEKYQAELVVLSETDSLWVDALLPEMDEYPFVIYRTRKDNFGISLFSKIPLDSAHIQEFGELNTPACIANISLGEDTVGIIGVHPRAPESLFHFNERNETFDRLVLDREVFPENLIVMGDMNITSYSPYFHSFLKGMHLKDSRKGWGLQHSWPANWFPFQIAIDHCLISQRWDVLHREIGEPVGSDHLPLYLVLGLK